MVSKPVSKNTSLTRGSHAYSGPWHADNQISRISRNSWLCAHRKPAGVSLVLLSCSLSSCPLLWCPDRSEVTCRYTCGGMSGRCDFKLKILRSNPPHPTGGQAFPEGLPVGSPPRRPMFAQPRQRQNKSERPVSLSTMLGGPPPPPTEAPATGGVLSKRPQPDSAMPSLSIPDAKRPRSDAAAARESALAQSTPAVAPAPPTERPPARSSATTVPAAGLKGAPLSHTTRYV